MRIDRAYLYAFSFVAIILVTIAISFACSLPIAPSYGKAGFSLSFPRERAASFVEVATWRIAGKGAGPDFSKDFPAASTTATIDELALGEWTISVDGLNTSGTSVFHAAKTVTLQEGDNALEITMDWTTGLLLSRFSFNNDSTSDSTGRLVAVPGSQGMLMGSLQTMGNPGSELEGNRYLSFPQPSPSPALTNGSWVDLKTGSGSSLDLGNAFTLAVWINPSNLYSPFAERKQVIISSQAGDASSGQTSSPGFTLSYNTFNGASPDGKLYVETGNGASRAVFDSGSAVLSYGKWQHIALSMDRKTGKAQLWLNGTAVGSGSIGSGFLADFDSNLPLRVGGMPSGRFFFAGLMDDWRIYTGNMDNNQVSTIIGEGAFAGGRGTSSEPFLVASPQQLNNVRFFLAGSFRQTDDITVSTSWTPIGVFTLTNSLVPFTGSYDGGGYRIINLSAMAYNDLPAGLFAVTSGASLRGINLQSVNVTASPGPTPTPSPAHAVGALVGAATNTVIHRCSSNGTVFNNGGTAQNGSNVGGLAGYVSGGSISESYSAASVTGFEKVGGLVGSCNANINNSYATGPVSGAASGDVYLISGLVGNAVGGSITASYAAGKVLQGSSTPAQGFAGYNGVTCTNCYWDMDASGASSSYGGGTGRTNILMIGSSQFSGWDFSSIWTIQEGNSYPYLRWQGVNAIPLPAFLPTSSTNRLFLSGNSSNTNGSQNLTAMGSPTWSSGALSGFVDGASFTGVVTGPAVVNIAGDYTISTWFKTSNSTTAHHPIVSQLATTPAYPTQTVGYLDHQTNFAFRIDTYGSNVWFTNGNNDGGWTHNTIQGTTAVTDNNWHQVVARVSGNVMTLFVDGVQNGSPLTRTGTYQTSSTQGVYFGITRNDNPSSDPFTYFPGSIGYTGFWARGLANAEIGALYRYEKPNYP